LLQHFQCSSRLKFARQKSLTVQTGCPAKQNRLHRPLANASWPDSSSANAVTGQRYAAGNSAMISHGTVSPSGVRHLSVHQHPIEIMWPVKLRRYAAVCAFVKLFGRDWQISRARGRGLFSLDVPTKSEKKRQSEVKSKQRRLAQAEKQEPRNDTKQHEEAQSISCCFVCVRGYMLFVFCPNGVGFDLMRENQLPDTTLCGDIKTLLG